jgi:hypothetical protein
MVQLREANRIASERARIASEQAHSAVILNILLAMLTCLTILSLRESFKPRPLVQWHKSDELKSQRSP